MAYQIVIAYFVNKLSQLLKATITLKEHKEVHGGEQQAEVIIKVIEEYEIPKSQIGYFTSRLHFLSLLPLSFILNTPNLGDNHSSNDKFC